MGLLVVIGLALAMLIPLGSWAVGHWLVRPHNRDLFDHMAAFQAVVTITAVVFGGFWFVIERPDAAKLEIQQSATGITLNDGRVLILTEIGLKNIGGTALDLRNREFLYWIQRVTPLPEAVEKDARRLAKDAPETIRPADTWGLIAALDRRAGERSAPLPATSPAKLDSYVEAGETENLYFRSILPCTPDLRVYVTLQMAKPSTWFDGAKAGEMWWVKQTHLDLTEQCMNTNEGG